MLTIVIFFRAHQEVKILDLASMSSVRQFAQDILASEARSVLAQTFLSILVPCRFPKRCFPKICKTTFPRSMFPQTTLRTLRLGQVRLGLKTLFGETLFGDSQKHHIGGFWGKVIQGNVVWGKVVRGIAVVPVFCRSLIRRSFVGKHSA
jgi:hypothetical protein